MKTDVTFSHGGFQIAGHLYEPNGCGPGRHPAIVVDQPGRRTGEQAAGLYAEHLADHGFITLDFDSRAPGAEEPGHRVTELQDAVSFLGNRARADPDRIGALGICPAGSYVVPEAGTDHRIRAVAIVSGLDPDTRHAQRSRSASQFTWSSSGLIAPPPLLVIVGQRTAVSRSSIRAFTDTGMPGAISWDEASPPPSRDEERRHVTAAVGTLADFFATHLGKAVARRGQLDQVAV